MKNNIIIFSTIATCIFISTTLHGATNCCGSCGISTNYDASCTSTESCCTNSTTRSAPDSNHIITVTKKTRSIVCATTTTGFNSASCLATYSCECEQGYYGTPSTIVAIANCSGTCTRCPSSNGVYGTTASSGATSITECYIPSGTSYSFSDTIGSGTATIQSDCYYSN